ncbi:hypothetical protein [Jeotgalibacillus sp. R-1-5s-1]|uniref:hypothetical protein n=1 Tax=Jeotgalibacillus sp. R-1-5s-1 TaxID=2555897 RepID=UPI00141AF848|nr:hypothetical protein [Jeotgalibacillus sp. R-1-5s-1]
MFFGIILLVICILTFLFQLRIEHEKRNVIILFLSLAGGMVGLWFVFDWLMFSL